MAVGNICVSFNQEQLDELKSYIKKELEKEIKNIESRPKGKWLKDIGCFECSYCGWLITAGDEEINNYCPHCGADMRGEEL